MSVGQMLEDVQLAVAERCPIHFYGRTGGVIPLPDEVLEACWASSRPAGQNVEPGMA